MAQAIPEKSCNNTVLKYTIEAKNVEAAKAQILKIAGSNPVIFIELPLPQGKLELTAMAASLTPSQKQELQALQADGVMVKKLAESRFEVKTVSFFNEFDT